MLGEETARLLRTAREASDDIRRKAEERSSNVMEEAQTEAHRLRTDAAEILGGADAGGRGAPRREIIGEAEARAADITRASTASPKNSGSAPNRRPKRSSRTRASKVAQMLDEARAARERVLTDLGRRRKLLQAQVEELRQGRDRLLEAYRVVKRTFLDATEALAQVEARAASERAHAPAEPRRCASTRSSLEQEILVDAHRRRRAAIDAAGRRATNPRRRRGGELRDVDSLFARIRAGQTDDDAT